LKIIVVQSAFRYGDPRGLEPTVEWFGGTLRRMGHAVRLFNMSAWHEIDRDAMNEQLLELVERRGADLILVQMEKHELYPETLLELKHRSITVAWNSDDDWRWAGYTSTLYPYFTFMITTYRHIYDAHRATHSNLLLSQWACSGLFDGSRQKKDIPISFVGLRYGIREAQISRLRRVGKLITYGGGFSGAEGDDGGFKWRLRRTLTAQLRLPLVETPLTYAGINAIHNRTRISFTPLEASVSPTVLQVKARVFDMGLSGTLMLCNRNPQLQEFYEAGKEYEDFGDMEECCDKARFYLRHESARHKIGMAYFERTKREHLWEHRFGRIFSSIGLR
jgi:hypothetical protein